MSKLNLKQSLGLSIVTIILTFISSVPIMLGIAFLKLTEFVYMKPSERTSLKNAYNMALKERFHEMSCNIICRIYLTSIYFLREIQENVEHKFCRKRK